MGYTLATTASVLFKAGRNVQTSGGSLMTSAAMMVMALSGAEAFVNTASGYDWTSNYATLGKDTKAVVRDAVSCIAAIDFINFDQSGYTSPQEATTMMNVLWGKYQDDMDLLKDSNARTFIGADG